jgi:hypothetical protein
MQSNGKKLEIPPELQKGLESVEAGAIPALITRRLENFLTELGLYRTSMTPEEAWKTLQQVANGEPASPAAPPPEPESQLAPPLENQTQTRPEPNPGGLRGRINRRKRN